jgi:hypothetical protein
MILYIDRSDWEEIEYGAKHGYIRDARTLYAPEEVGDDWEAEGKVKVEMTRVYE